MLYIPVFLHRSIDGIFIPHFCSYKYLLKPREGNIFFILFQDLFDLEEVSAKAIRPWTQFEPPCSTVST